MSKPMYNSQGVQVGESGYILCRHCGLEAQDVSREVRREYAYHVKCKPDGCLGMGAKRAMRQTSRRRM